jgi:hypothetical protein
VIEWLIVVGYVLMGIGAARYVLARRGRSYPYAAPSDPEIVIPTFLAFWLWPLALVVCLLVIPVGTVVAPMFLKWFTSPYKTARTKARGF